jgi:hypothetical protein
MKLPDNILVFRGIEISTDCGHLLVYGLTDDSWNTWGKHHYFELSKIVQNVHQRGGVCVPAHPFRGRESLGDHLFTAQGLDAIETHNGVNGPKQNQLAMEAAAKLGLPTTGGSDCHYLEQVGRACTEFVNPVRTMEDLVRWQLDGTGFTLEDFDAKGFVAYGKRQIFWDRKDGLKFKTPSGKIELVSSLMESAGFPSFPPYTPQAAPPAAAPTGAPPAFPPPTPTGSRFSIRFRAQTRESSPSTPAQAS